MQTDYLWVRHAPVEEGVKVRYYSNNQAIMGITTCTIGHQTASKDWK